MWNVWRTVLEENEKLARARLAAVEVFSSHVADDAKILRANKLVNAKRVSLLLIINLEESLYFMLLRYEILNEEWKYCQLLLKQLEFCLHFFQN